MRNYLIQIQIRQQKHIRLAVYDDSVIDLNNLHLIRSIFISRTTNVLIAYLLFSLSIEILINVFNKNLVHSTVRINSDPIVIFHLPSFSNDNF